MKDVYLMNKETGEILPSSVAIKEFYRYHGFSEAWTDVWEETGIETDEDIEAPDFTKVF